VAGTHAKDTKKVGKYAEFPAVALFSVLPIRSDRLGLGSFGLGTFRSRHICT